MYCIVSPVSGISVREISKKMEGGCSTRHVITWLARLCKRLLIHKKTRCYRIIVRWMNCICSGLKGKNHHNIIISSKRLPKRRAVKPPLGRGKFDRDFPMILCYHQRGDDTIFAVPQKYPSIASLVCMIISRGSHIYTD